MDDLSQLLRKAFRTALIFILICAAAGLIVPSIRSIALGLIVGTVASIVSMWQLGQKTEHLTKNLLAKPGRRSGLGTLTRVCIAVLAVMLAYKEPRIDLVGTVIGLVFVQFTIIVGGIISGLRNQ